MRPERAQTGPPDSRPLYCLPMKPLLDLAPFLVFLSVTLTTDIYKGTMALMASLLVLIAFYRIKFGEWHKMHLVAAAITLVLGGMTIYFHDANFIKLKPTILFAGFSVVLLGSQFIGDKVIVERVAGNAISLPPAVWRKVNIAWVIFYAACAVLNLYVAHMYSDKVWAIFKFGGLTVLPLLFAAAHAPFLSQYINDSTQDKGTT